MRRMLLTLLLVCLWCPSGFARSELECLTEAVLAESTLSREPFAGDEIVAYVIYRHSRDGRWGKTICETINKRYPRTTQRVVRVEKDGKIVRLVRKVVSYVCDFSYKCKSYYRDIMKKTPAVAVERARLVAQVQLAGLYEPPEGFEEAIDYLYPEYSSEKGKLWFACTGVPLGRVAENSIHVVYREMDDKELEQTRLKRPDCRRSIDIFKEDRDRNRKKTLYAHNP